MDIQQRYLGEGKDAVWGRVEDGSKSRISGLK